MKFVHIFSNYLFKSTENTACGSVKGNNDDITKISSIQNFMKMDYDDKHITRYILGNWKEAENVIQQYQVLTTMQYSRRKCSPAMFGDRGTQKKYVILRIT